VLEGWVVEPSPEVKAVATSLQGSLARFDWIDLVPEHFLHVWLGAPERLGDAPERWPEVVAFEVRYPRANCFHSAVVVEATPPIRRLVAGTKNDLPEFLPHMTIAVTRMEHSADELRDELTRLRETDFGTQTVGEAKLVRFPAAQSTLFQPWEVVETVRLGQRPS
jgi:2'-5' RNA ligase